LSTRLEIKPTLGPDGAPIRNPYREVMSIAYGFFSPLEGFMPWNEVESVLRERRLLSGWLFPFLVVFDVSEEELKVSGARQVDDPLLTLKGRPFAALKVEEVYKLPDRGELAAAVFGFWRGSCGLWFLPLAVTGFTAESCR
jgi:sulfate adenylyltransferase